MATPNKAIDAYENAISSEPGRVAALTALESLYRRREMWRPLVATLKSQAAVIEGEDPSTAADVRAEIARLLETKLETTVVQRLRFMKIALPVIPKTAKRWRHWNDSTTRPKNHERYVEVLEARLDATSDNGQRVAIYERISTALEQRFSDFPRAAEYLEQALMIDDKLPRVYNGLARLYRCDRNWDGLVDVNRRHIMATTETTARVDLYCAMGEVYENELADTARSIEAYTDVLSFDADNGQALDALCRLYERNEDWDRRDSNYGPSPGKCWGYGRK